jgi:hypothetical protein
MVDGCVAPTACVVGDRSAAFRLLAAPMPRSSSASRSGSLPSFGRLIGALTPSGGTLRTTAMVLAWGGVLGGLGYALVVNLPMLRAHAEAKGTADPTAIAIRFEDTPTWMPNTTLRQLAFASHQAMASASPLEVEALQRVHQELLASGWFTRIEQVRRTAANEILVSGAFRSPIAMVRWEGEDHLIDEQGRRLPLAYSGSGPRPRLPLILGVALPKPAESGAIWLGADLRAALNLTALLRERVWFANGQVEAIDTARFAYEGIVELVTDRGTRIVWGGDPNDRSLSEMPADRKLAALDAMYQVSKRVDNGGDRTIDIRFDVVTLAPQSPSSDASTDAESDDLPSRLTASVP